MLRERDGDLDVRLRADTATECVEWLMHLKQAQDLNFAAGSRVSEVAAAEARAEACAQSGLHREPSEVYCCVCLCAYTDKVTAECSHAFCADCIVRVCLSAPSDGPVRRVYACAFVRGVTHACACLGWVQHSQACARYANLAFDCVSVCPTLPCICVRKRGKCCHVLCLI